jgi:hypothetical protein
MPDTNPSVLRDWFERVWNEKNENAIDELMEANARLGITDPSIKSTGVAHVKEVFRLLQSKFLNLQIAVDNVRFEGDLEYADCTISAQFNGYWIEFKGIATARVENGKIVWGSNDFDLRLHAEADRLMSQAGDVTQTARINPENLSKN